MKKCLVLGWWWSTILAGLLSFFQQCSYGFVQPENHVKVRLADLRMSDTKEEEGTLGILDGGKSFSQPDMGAYSSGYSTVFNEQRCQLCEPSFGTIPNDIQGTYYRSGPSMFTAGSIIPPKTSIVQPKVQPVPDGQDMDRMVPHPFDADGALLAITINSVGEVISRLRYVRTNAFNNERRKGLRMYKAMDSTRELGKSDLFSPTFKHHLEPGLNKKRKNTSNTRALYWGKKLITMWEGGLPYKLDDLALSTEGRSQLGGVLKESDPLGGSSVYDSRTNKMLFYCNRQDRTSSELLIHEFNAKFRLEKTIETELPGFALLSGFAATERYYIFVQPPVTANTMQYLLSKEPGKTLQLEDGPSTLHLISRDSSKGTISVEIPYNGISDADLQFINAFEDDDGNIVFDAIRMDSRTIDEKAPQYPWATSLQDFSSKTAKRDLVRYTVRKGSGVSKEVLLDQQCYFGVINPAGSCQKHQYIYVAVGAMGKEVAPPQGIGKFDTRTGEMIHTWMPESYEFCGEPMFAPSTDEDAGLEEDDGYILTVLYNGKMRESELIILSAKDLSLQTRIPLGISAAHGLHGCFSKGDDFKADEINRRAKLADKMESRGNMWNEVKSDFSGLGLRLDDWEDYFGDIL